MPNEASGASRTFVVSGKGQVIAYYALAAGSIRHAMATGRVRRNAPDPVPVMIIGRLAVDQRWQGQGIARGLLREAVLRTVHAAKEMGIRAIVVHAISDAARRFYEAHGFAVSPLEPMTLMITVADAEKELRKAMTTNKKPRQ